jgi:serine/threonine protein kinase/predicted ATPase
MRKKDPASQVDERTAEHHAMLVSAHKERTPQHHNEQSPIGSELPTITLDGPSMLRAESLASDVKPRDRIGKNRRFEIIERLGAGGMGVVFAAFDRHLDRSVAIKFILSDPRISWDQLVKILRREAMATARLRHDNIVSIFDIATWKKVPYLVMEHLQGDSLALILSKSRLSLLRTVEIMIDVTRGISHAHENGIIHRDLKPSNVFVLKEGRAKILDFGLASFAQLPTQSPISGGPSLTAGTPAFMAPEQWRGASQDERTDIWAMGVMFFQLFTGQLPYPSANNYKLYEEICSERPAPSVLSLRDDLPEQTEMIVARAMQKKPEARFQTAAQLLEALVGFRDCLIHSPEARRQVRRTLQRRQLTFLSCGLTPLATNVEDTDEDDDSISKFTALCADVINALNGRLVAVLGSRVLACFGHPIAREGDAERAVRAGLQIVQAVRRTLGHHGAPSHRLRVGIHTGLEIVEDVEGEPEAFHTQGTTPQLAASLESQADNDAVVIGHSTYQLAGGVFDIQHLGSMVVEGSSQPMAAYRVLRERDIDNRFDVSFASRQTLLVGREPYVESLVELWRCAKNSSGHFVLLTGEAGIGKSRLVRVLKDRVATDSGARMSCQCWSQFKSSAFHPVIELLLKSMDILREDSTEQKLRKLESFLSTLGMDSQEGMLLIASLLSIPMPGSSSLSLDPPERKKRTLGTLTAMALALSAKRPVLFVAEDLHWADHSTLELLGALLEQAGSARILIIGTARPEFRALWPEHPNFNEMSISHLPPQLAAKMVERTAGDSKLPADVIEALVRKTEGVPLFIEEMTRMVVDSVRGLGDGAAVGEFVLAQAIPATLNELLLARLDRLTAAGKEVAQIAAVVGRSFRYPLIQRMSGMGQAALHNALLSLSEADVLLCQGGPPESRYQFKHFLIQDAAYHSLPKKKRREHHLKAAQVLTELLPETAEIQPELLAHHFTEAGDVEQALEYWDRAGRRAAERSANIEAINHFTQAIQMLSKVAEGPDRNRRELSLQLALGAPLMAVKGYAAPEVERAYARARDLCRNASEDVQLFPALQGLWQFYMVSGELPTARELAEQLLGVAQNSADSTLLLLAYRSLATTAFLQGEIVRCRDLTEVGLALYDPRQHGSLGLRYGHDPGVAHGLYAAWSLWLLGYPEQALKKSIEAVAIAENLSHPVSVAFARCYRAVVRNSCGEHVAAAADAATAKAISSEHQLALWLSVGTMMEGWARVGLEEWDEGIALLQQGVSGWRSTGARAGMTFFLVTLAEAYGKAGRPKDGMVVLDEAEALVARNSEHYYEAELYRVKGELRLALAPEDPASAEAEIERAIAIARQQQARSLQLRATTSLSRLPQRRSRPQETRALLYEIYRSFAEGLGTADLLMAKAALEALTSSDEHLT